MKRIMSIALCVMMMALCTTNVMAETTKSDKNKLSREELANKRATGIANRLALDEQTTARFVATFMDYQKEVWALGPRVRNKDMAGKSDAEVEQTIKQGFDRSAKISKIREKYYGYYRQFLTPKQIQRVYAMERKAMHHKHAKKGHGTHRHHRRTA